MIVTTTPLRVSFFGGGSDIPQFYNETPGMVISTTIDKYIHIAVNKCQTKHVRAVYSEMEVAEDAYGIKHDRIRETLKLFSTTSNVEICSFSDMHTKGTGLGSSSTFTVGMVKAMFEMNKLIHHKRDVADLACQIEIDRCNQPIGKQDQYAAAYGGFNVIRFYKDGVDITPIDLSANTLRSLNDNLLFYSTGNARSTSDILSDQVNNLECGSAFDNTCKMVDLAEIALEALKAGKFNDFGVMLGESWHIKKTLSKKISNENIDVMYDIATSAGALGGKLLGAGGGGFMMFYVPSSRINAVKLAMREYRQFHVNFTGEGSVAKQI